MPWPARKSSAEVKDGRQGRRDGRSAPPMISDWDCWTVWLRNGVDTSILPLMTENRTCAHSPSAARSWPKCLTPNISQHSSATEAGRMFLVPRGGPVTWRVVHACWSHQLSASADPTLASRLLPVM